MADRRSRAILTATAYHEAGHAAVAFYLDVKLKRVSIVADEQEGSGGHVLHDKMFRGLMAEQMEVGFDLASNPDAEAKARLRIEKAILIALAGREAQRRHN